MLRGGFEIRDGLSQRSLVMHRLSMVMGRAADDLQHTFFVTTKDQARNGIGRRTKAIFKIDERSEKDTLELTTRTHRPLLAGSHEGDITYVKYALQDSQRASGRTDLYRGETAVLPEDFREEPAMRLIARNIKTFNVEFWRGDSWQSADWDSARSDTRNKLPRMIKLTLVAWSEDREDEDGTDERADQSTEQIISVIHIPEALAYKELKDATSSIKWSDL